MYVCIKKLLAVSKMAIYSNAPVATTIFMCQVMLTTTACDRLHHLHVMSDIILQI